MLKLDPIAYTCVKMYFNYLELVKLINLTNHFIHVCIYNMCMYVNDDDDDDDYFT